MVLLAAAIPCEVESVFSMRDSEKLNKSFKLFYESHLWMYQEFLPKMIEKNHGHVVVVSSECVFTKLAFIHTYSGMKTAQAKLFECVDSELNYSADNKIKTTLIYLGGLRRGISTTMIRKFLVNNPIGMKYIDKFGLSDEYASKRIVKSVLKNEKYVYLPFYVYLIVFIKYFLPTACCELLLTSRNFINNRSLLVYNRDIPTVAVEKKVD
jgi:all-trans-retinol dehydrogenase (NAD+)